MSRTRQLRVVVAGVAAAALAVPLSMGAAAAAPPDDDGPTVPSAPSPELAAGLPAAGDPDLAGTDRAEDRISRALREADGVVTAFVELEAPSGVETAEAGGDSADVAAAVAEVEQVAEDVVPADAGEPADPETPAKVAVTANVVSGVVVTGDAQEIAALAADPAVTAVHLVVPKTLDNKGTDVFTRAIDAWTSAGATGEGVTIGVIDTGLDYTHATFGGPGTTEAYAEAYGEDGTGPVPAGLFDPTKFLGGYDFAGPLYDAGGTTEAELVPQPDENPIDAPHTAGGGHGSHVAGTATGFGVTADGATFRGDYAALEDISDWQVGPGTAPEAGVYALKVFGDVGGSTGLVVQALDWAADPNGDGDYSDHLDVVNMSLGSDLSPADDPESLFVDRLTELGVLTVTSAGNGGDVTDVGGSPGNAASALTVANSVASTQTFDAVEVTAAPDPALVGTHAAQNSQNYAGGDDVTAPVAYVGADVDGCTVRNPDGSTTNPLLAYADQLAGNVAWLWWNDDDAARRCGSADRWNNAEAAGAVGVLIGTELPVFTAGIAGNAGIPGAQLTAASTDALLPAIQAATAEAPVVVHLGPSLANAAFVTDPSLGDTLNSGSSRGVHGSLGVVKPDVAAPGTLISSAASGTGDGTVTYSGTSMSSPHVAGIAALVTQAHPEWSPQQVKAAVMNTATHDVYSELGQTGPVYGPERVGSGRVDALDAVNASVLAYDTENPELVSVTFGLVDVGATRVTLQRTVTVANTGNRQQTFTTSFDQSTTAGSATVSVSPRQVTVRPGKTATVKVTLTVDPATLSRDIDPTQATTYLGSVAREYVTSVSGRLVLTPRTGPELRVPVQAAPRPVSELTSPAIAMTTDQTSAPLVVEGRPVASGGWYSLMAPFGLVASSPALEGTDAATPPTAFRAADVQHVGFTSTAPEIAAAGGAAEDGVMALGISTYGEWATLGGVIVPVIDTDVDGDGTYDYETYVWKYADDMDLTTVETYDLRTGQGVDVWTANGIDAPLDSSVFDSNVMVVPFTLAALGVEPGDTPTFAISTFSPYEGTSGGFVDQVDPFTVDPYDPPVWFDVDPTAAESSLWYVGAPGADVTVHRRADVTDADLLVLHTHNDNVGTPRAQVVDLTVADPKAASQIDAVAPRSVLRGLPVPVSAVVRTAGPTPSGRIEVSEGDRVVGSASVVTVGRTGVAVALVHGLGVGRHQLTVSYLGNDAVAPSSDTVTVTVTSPRGPGRR